MFRLESSEAMSLKARDSAGFIDSLIEILEFFLLKDDFFFYIS